MGSEVTLMQGDVVSGAVIENVEVTHCRDHADLLHIRLNYPRNQESVIKTLELNLGDVRAADGIRIHYDFERDGWSIQQASRFEWDEDDEDLDNDWQEVAFVQAWAREETLDERRAKRTPPDKT